MLTHFKYDLYHFQNIKGRYLNRLRQEYNRFMTTIWRTSLDAFWSQEPGTVMGNLIILRKMVMMTKEQLGLEVFPPLLGTYPLKGQLGMRVACVTFRLYLIKGVYVGHLQWDSMRKAPTAWANSYVAGVLEIGGTIFARDGKKFTDIACPT